MSRGRCRIGLPAIARAQSQPPIGTWPAGVSGNTAFVGISVPRTGTYAVPGEDELKGYQLAIEHIKSGHELIRADGAQSDQGAARQEGDLRRRGFQRPNRMSRCRTSRASSRKQGHRAHRFLLQSAEAVADNKFGQREKVIYLPGVAGPTIPPARTACAIRSAPASTARPPRPRLARC